MSSEKLEGDDLKIFRQGWCPECMGHLTVTARGGFALNYRCDRCSELFWDGGLFGVERVPQFSTCATCGQPPVVSRPCEKCRKAICHNCTGSVAGPVFCSSECSTSAL